MIYLDMDGVIADFFGEIARRFDVDHWKSIQNKEVAFQKLANTDFFNCIPCFFEYEERGLGPQKRYNLSAMIVEKVKTVAWENDIAWGICSSPMRGDQFNSAYWKRVWLERMGFMPEVENCIFTSNKHKYAYSKIDSLPNVLIDDKPENIMRFEKAGGIGIRYQANWDDFEYLEAKLAEAMEQRICR